MRILKLQCEIVTPIHIGSGSEIDPFKYVIKDGYLYEICFEKFIANLTERERSAFETMIDTGDIVKLREYIINNADTQKHSLYSMEVSDGISSLYHSRKADIQNQLLINPFIRTEGKTKPFIPGSSVKGAIRTAIISELARKKRIPKPRDFREENVFEAKVLGYKDVKNDPFRAVKIRDALLNNDNTIVRDIRNVSKTNGNLLKANKIQIICELTHSSITGHAISFETDLLIDDALYSTRFLGKSLTKEQIVASCTMFYRDKMENEHKKFYQNTEAEICSTQLLNTPLDENSFLLRLGRFSSVESVTLDNYRNPRPPGNKTVWGTTRNLAEGIYPMGWLRVNISA